MHSPAKPEFKFRTNGFNLEDVLLLLNSCQFSTTSLLRSGCDSNFWLQGFHPLSDIAFLLLARLQKDPSQILFSEGTILCGEMLNNNPLLPFHLTKFHLALYQSVLNRPFCLLELPTCQKLVAYGTPRQ